MKRHPVMKKTVLCTLIASMLAAPVALAAPLDLVQMPAGQSDRTPAPNVIISVDDSGSMEGTKMNTLKAALTSVFNDQVLLPDGKIRLAWQVMWNNGGAPSADTIGAGNVNSMKVLNAAHRANFQAFVNSLEAENTTPSHSMMRQADAYMRTGKSINSPWASNPGVQELPYLGCRRAYHIFMTDGRWNKFKNAADTAIGNVDGTNTTLPNGMAYTAGATQTRIFGDTYPQTTLADWAFRSWATDLQPTIADQVTPTVDYLNAPLTETLGTKVFDKFWNPKYNPATWQHMVTYSIGYGNDAVTWANGLGILKPTDTRPFGWDLGFVSLMTGLLTWPDLSPAETNRSLDLWHAAINGRGRFYAVTQNAHLRAAFESILQRINDENSASVAGMAASASTNIYKDVGVYTAGYDASKAWTGYVYADKIGTDGALSRDTTWGLGAGTMPPTDHVTTADKLDALSDANIATRFILTTRDTTNTGVLFKWATDETYMSTAQKALLNLTDMLGQDRVNFLRGDRNKEVPKVGGVFRTRQSRQGDIVNSGVWYVGAPASSTSRLGYKEFRQSQASRKPMIYVGGNDGMLHGFQGADGAEKIAYVPKGVITKLPQLTATDYSHKYFVDNTPFTGDVNLLESATTAATTNWRTMLVGTLGAGGRGYFVLDVTNPNSGFTDANAASLVVMDKTLSSSATPAATTDDAEIGHIFAAPVMHETNPYMTTQVTRMNNGRWAVVLGNGYNSVNERPVLLIQYLDGAKELKKLIATGTALPGANEETKANGLSAPRVVDINGDGTVDIVYAGDLKGNLWKFDVTSPDQTQWKVAFGGHPLYTALSGTAPATKRQSITAPPTVKANDRGAGGMMVAFGTGRNLTVDDRSNDDPQSIYSVLDNTRYRARSAPDADKLEVHPGGGTCPGTSCIAAPAVVGSGVSMLKQQLVQSSSTGSGAAVGTTFWNLSANDVNWNTQKGWYLNLAEGRERSLKAMPFFDGSNIMAVFTQVPATGSSSTAVEEACTAPETQERQYLTLLNIMDGKPPSIPVMNRNGDAFYNAADGGVSRMTIDAGATGMVTGQKSITVLAGGPGASGSIYGNNSGSPKDLRPMPEPSVRPSWRQMR